MKTSLKLCVCILLASLIAISVTACRKDESPQFPTQKPRNYAEPITEKGLDAVMERVKKAGDLIIKYAEKHGRYPKVYSTVELRDLLKQEFGDEPGFDDLFVSHTGQAYLIYNSGLAGRSTKEFSSATADRTKLIWDPAQIKPFGNVTAYMSGRMDTVIEKPISAGVGNL